MPLQHYTKAYAVEDLKIAKITADPAGGTTTYATTIDIPGVKSITLAYDIKTSDLRGDNTLLDSNSTLQNVTATISHAKVNFDAVAVLMGGTVADAGTTPAQTVTYSRSGTGTFSYFKVEGKTPTNGADPTGGDLHLVLYRCIYSGGEPFAGFAEEDYQTLSFSVRCLQRLSDAKLLDVVMNETAVAIT